MRSVVNGSTSARRVLRIPELLDITFNFLDRKANVANACVCKQWSEIALDIVWKDVDDLLLLLRLLKPISHDEIAFKYRFETFPEANDWARFEKYATRVRSLKFQSAKYSYEVCPLLDDVARTRTSLEILPNMHTLEWLYSDTAHMVRCKMFLHSRLRNLSVTAPSQPDHRPGFYTDLCARAPHLHSLSLFVVSPGNPIDAELCILLENLPELRKIVLPEFHYTSAVIEQLSRAKNITSVDFDQDLKLGCGNPANVASFCPMLEDGAFPCLRELNLTARVDDLDRFFHSSFAPIHLTLLYVNSYTEHTPAEVHTFLTTLSRQCQLVTKLHLQLFHKAFPLSLPTDQQLSYATIKPILSFPNLSSFELVHKYPLNITLDDLDDLASKWPHLESLMLNAEPLFLDRSAFSLDLRALLPFARHCPRLHLLGLYINATEVNIPLSQVPLEPFNALRTLSLGTSHARDTSAVAAFLSWVLPPRCVLDMSISWTEVGSEDNRFLPANILFSLQKRCMAWHGVQRLLPLLTRLRQEEKERSRALQEEVEDLRIRNRLLMDKADTKAKDSCTIA